MNREHYYRTVEELQKARVDPDYIQGWIAAYMGNPKREEQRVTEAYEAGYADGESGATDGRGRWTPDA